MAKKPDIFEIAAAKVKKPNRCEGCKELAGHMYELCRAIANGEQVHRSLFLAGILRNIAES